MITEEEFQSDFELQHSRLEKLKLEDLIAKLETLLLSRRDPALCFPPSRQAGLETTLKSFRGVLGRNLGYKVVTEELVKTADGLWIVFKLTEEAFDDELE